MNASELDPGIRRTVVCLLANGFRTTDSGDGVTKIAADPSRALSAGGEVLDEPHVFMLVDSAMMVGEAHRLVHLLSRHGRLTDDVTIEVSYSPRDCVAILALRGFDDSALDP